jgi:hypothetical protein
MAFLDGARALGPTLTLRQFNVESRPSDGVYVEIIGRPAGLLGWLLTVAGLASEQRFKATANDIVLDSGGLQGRRQEMAPISGITSASVGYQKSLWTLLSGLAVLGYGLVRGFAFDSKIALVVGLVIGGALLVKYWLSKRLHVAVETNGGRFIGLSFKRSVIENVVVDFEKCSSVIDVLQQLVLASQSRRDVRSVEVAGPPPAAQHAPAMTPVGASPRRCAKCGSLLQPADNFCEGCGARANS